MVQVTEKGMESHLVQPGAQALGGSGGYVACDVQPCPGIAWAWLL